MYRRLHCKLDDTKRGVNAQQRNTLNAEKLSAGQGGDCHDQHHQQHDRYIHHQAGIDAKEHGALGNRKRRQCNGYSAD